MRTLAIDWERAPKDEETGVPIFRHPNGHVYCRLPGKAAVKARKRERVKVRLGAAYKLNPAIFNIPIIIHAQRP